MTEAEKMAEKWWWECWKVPSRADVVQLIQRVAERGTEEEDRNLQCMKGNMPTIERARRNNRSNHWWEQEAD